MAIGNKFDSVEFEILDAKRLYFGNTDDQWILVNSTGFRFDATARNQTIAVGESTAGMDFTFFGSTASNDVLWDTSANTWYFGGADGTGVDVAFRGDTAGATVLWDMSQDRLEFRQSTATVRSFLFFDVLSTAPTSTANRGSLFMRAGTGNRMWLGIMTTGSTKRYVRVDSTSVVV